MVRELDLDVKTVRKWWKRTWRPQRRAKRGRVLDAHRPFLVGRAPEVGFNAVVLHRELVALGYDGSYSAVVKYLQPLRGAWRPEEAPTVRFETAPGEQAQVDWGSTWVYLGTERVRVHLFTMVLAYSRRLFVRAYRSEGLESLLDGHERAFEHFGGRTATILYDNPRTIVVARHVQGPDGLLRRGDSPLPVLPGPGQGRERGQVREAQCPGGAAVSGPGRAQRVAPLVGPPAGIPAGTSPGAACSTTADPT